jgi:hypothetical protein
MGIFDRIRRREKSSNKLTYKLETNGSRYGNDELSVAGFADYLNHFTPEHWDFMTLTPSMPIKGSTFIQVGAPDVKTDLKMEVEIGIANPGRIEMYRHYTDDKKEVLQILADYFERQEIPDYTGWDDMSNEMNPK